MKSKLQRSLVTTLRANRTCHQFIEFHSIFLRVFQESDVNFVPCSGLTGENLTKHAKESSLKNWYKGPSMIERIGINKYMWATKEKIASLLMQTYKICFQTLLKLLNDLSKSLFDFVSRTFLKVSLLANLF